MARIHQPSHPGEILREDILPALGLTPAQAAEQLGIDRSSLSRLLNEQSGISIIMALRLEAWLGVENGGRAELWLSQQTAYDLWKTREENPNIQVKRRIALTA